MNGGGPFGICGRRLKVACVKPTLTRETSLITTDCAHDPARIADALRQSPLGPDFAIGGSEVTKYLAAELAVTSLECFERLGTSKIMTALLSGTLTSTGYRSLLIELVQQVNDGSRWMARAASSVDPALFPVRQALTCQLAGESALIQLIESDIAAAGGSLIELHSAERGMAAEALHGYVMHEASGPDPFHLIGVMFIVQGLMTRLPEIMPMLLRCDGVSEANVSFLREYETSCEDALSRIKVLLCHPWIDAPRARRLVKSAQVASQLHAMRFMELCLD